MCDSQTSDFNHVGDRAQVNVPLMIFYFTSGLCNCFKKELESQKGFVLATRVLQGRLADGG